VFCIRYSRLCITPRSLVILEIVEEAQDAQKEVEEVKVQADGSHDVLIWGKSVVDQVRVVYDVSAEQERPSNRVQQVDGVREGNEQPNNPRHTDSNKAAEEPRTHAGKVILGLKSEGCQAQENSQGDQQRLEDNCIVEVCAHNSESERLQEGESGQKNEAEWVLMAFPVQQAEIDEYTKHGEVERPWIGLNPEDCGWRLRKHTANDSCGEDLYKEYRVNLPHECIPNLGATFAHRHSVLEVVWNISKVGLVVDSPCAGAGLGGSLAT